MSGENFSNSQHPETSQTPESQTPENQTPENQAPENPSAPSPAAQTEVTPTDSPSEDSGKSRRILIGSQRDPGVPMPRAKKDWTVPEEKKEEASAPSEESEPKDSAPAPEGKPVEEVAEEAKVDLNPAALEKALERDKSKGDAPLKHFPPPSIRGKLSPELEAELEEMLSGEAIESLMDVDESITKQEMLEREAKCKATVVAIQEEDIFVELGGREQGVVAKKSFDEVPEIGQKIDVIVNRFNQEDGIYDLTLPGMAADVGDWSDLEEGMTVEARVTGHNTGGLECEVNHIRGFIPISQISDYRVENIEPFVGEKFVCLVTEANPSRGNLVLSRRAIIEREKEAAGKELLASLETGQIHEGVVRKLMDFGAFVDLGGVDGLLHISELGWGRVNHPSEVVSEGQTVKVMIKSIDLETKRIGLSYRETLENPWDSIQNKYPTGEVVKGTVVKLMEFGAFVELEPGVEGLIHISELDHKRVFRVSDVVKEGEEVEVMVKSVDPDARRIGLSMKDTLPVPTKEKKEDELPDDEPIKPIEKVDPKTLKGGIGGRESEGGKFGLKW